MATQWEKLCGDTSRFAVKVSFAPDPDEGEAIDPDVSVSWGGFQIWVHGRNLCAHQEEGERIEFAHWYLLPLFEWFVAHWNPLLHEERLPARNAAESAWASLRETRFPPPAVDLDEHRAQAWEHDWQQWWRRHALRAAQEGGLFPDVLLRRCRDAIEVSWGSTPRFGMPGHFVFEAAASGCAALEPRHVAEPVHDLLTDAGEYLASIAPDSDRIRTLNRGVRALRTPHKEERLGWLAGLGMDAGAVRTGWSRVRSYVREHSQTLRRSMLATSGDSKLVVEGACQAALMFGTLAPDVRKDDVLQLAEVMQTLHQPTEPSSPSPITSMCRAVPLDHSEGPAWYQGYRLAEDFHEQLGVAGAREGGVDVDRVLVELGVQVLDLDLTDKTIRGVAIAGPRYRPGIACNRINPFNRQAFGKRFTIAHELCHLLFDRDAGQRLAVASGPWAPVGIERRANAFAAMFLMPIDLVRDAVAALSEPLESQSGVMAVASRLDTGFTSTLRHLKNLGFIDEHDEQRISAEHHSSIH